MTTPREDAAALWKKKAKMYRRLYRNMVNEYHEWRQALRLAGIGRMVDLNPDAVRLTVTVPSQKRVDELVAERVAALGAEAETPMPPVETPLDETLAALRAGHWVDLASPETAEALRVVFHNEYEADMSGDRYYGCHHVNQHQSTWDCVVRRDEVLAAMRETAR